MPSRTRKLRGSRTHGRGKKAGRGAGLRGGRGNAGHSKSKKLRTIKYGIPMGRHGFKRPQSVVADNITINVGELCQKIQVFVDMEFATEKGGAYSVDLTKAGIDKLLGGGDVSLKMDVTVSQASAVAMEKIQAAGGAVNLPSGE
ncbi:MAG: 50S ribosomal protein L15 [Thermoplasmatales archaeon]|nr:50S ribosomal protein L15 [Thermoplasmatales archaeon]